MKEINDSLIEKLFAFLGEENLRWFKHLKGLKGDYSPVLKLNTSRKFMPVHPVHLREGMQIRNWMRGQKECNGWNAHDYDNNWTRLVELTVQKYLP